MRVDLDKNLDKDVFHTIKIAKIEQYCILRFSGQFLGLFIYFFFCEKILNAQKRKSNKNQLTKQKKRTKNNKSNNIRAHKNFKEDQNRLFCVLVLLYAQNLFVKKKKSQQAQNCPDNLKIQYYLSVPAQPSYGEFFSTNHFLSHLPIFYLCAFITISVKTYSALVLISKNFIFL